VGQPQFNPQTHHRATDIGSECVALGKHVKGDSKTYLILLYTSCVYISCQSSVKGITNSYACSRAWLVLPSKEY